MANTFVENVNIVASGMSAMSINQTDLNNLLASIGTISGVTNGYITYGLPTTANIGDIVVNVIDGGIYQWSIVSPSTFASWHLIAQSSGGTSSAGTTTTTTTDPITGVTTETVITGDGAYSPPVIVSDAYPALAPNGTLVYNVSDGTFGAFINGAWEWINSTPSATDVIGIAVFITDPTTGNFEGRTIFNTTEMKLKMFTGGVWLQVVEPTTAAATVADGSLTTAAFASTIRPVEIFTILPTTGNALGRLVYLTTDGQLYRYTASGFTSAVPADVITGTIATTQIADDAITTQKITTGAITSDSIAANAIVAGKIASNAISAGMIQAGAIGATQIATNAITADKIAAGSITSSKISALSIDATKIVAGSISSDQLASNSVVAGKIAAGAISGSHIAGGTIVGSHIAGSTIHAGHLAAYTITADKIQTGSITLDKLTSSTTVVNGVTFGLGNGSSIAGYSSGGFFSASSADKFGLLASNTSGMAFGAGTLSSSAAGGFYNGTSSSYTSFNNVAEFASLAYAGMFTSGLNGSAAVMCDSNGAFSAANYTTGMTSFMCSANGGLTLEDSTDGSYFFALPTGFGSIVSKNNKIVTNCTSVLASYIQNYTSSKGIDVGTSSYAVYLRGAVAPFTGSHDALLSNIENIEVGDIVSDTGVSYNLSVSDTITIVSRSTTQLSNSVVGIYVSTDDEHEPISMSILDDKSKKSILKKNKIIVMNSLGEGMVNVCGLGGDLNVGDLITVSSIKGKGMKQSDDIIRSSTVAKVRENIKFDTSEQVKMVSCIYMCG